MVFFRLKLRMGGGNIQKKGCSFLLPKRFNKSRETDVVELWNRSWKGHNSWFIFNILEDNGCGWGVHGGSGRVWIINLIGQFWDQAIRPRATSALIIKPIVWHLNKKIIIFFNSSRSETFLKAGWTKAFDLKLNQQVVHWCCYFGQGVPHKPSYELATKWWLEKQHQNED